ncbi:7-carboxy-7-deazaguanine synthase [Pleionea mediterranea]|uniref:7-carboxy-7-deazaguanine synthase n=2 Tax=Pleionea mediterranea TaxID=523701 RepID=A0A316G1G7_9GAMM|nr:7-carboxy-7-deazaguanine synthase [Pleionea mediterranea]
MGLPTVFIRLTGCPLRCHYCDTEYAFTGGEYMSLDEILSKVASFNPKYITVTGGEPLAQKAPCEELMTRLCDNGYSVSIETSGAMDISLVDPRVNVVLDLKTPDSGEMSKNLWSNIERLKPSDEVKFVICSRKDYDWARMKVNELCLAQKCDVLFSPSFGQQAATQLADWIVADNLPVRFQVQLHKILWNDEPGH